MVFAPTDGANRRAVTPRRRWALSRTLRQLLVCAVTAVALALPVGLAGTAAAQGATSVPHKLASGWTSLKLRNGWTNAPFGTSAAKVRLISGIVHFKGAIGTVGSNPVAFVLPSSFRPSSLVYLPVDLCNATNGRLVIAPSGVVSVEAENGTFSNAQCFTSLDGASFARSASSFTSLKLRNGWTNAPFSTSAAKVRLISGIVHFKGAIATSGSNPVAFTLPSSFRPVHEVYIAVDLCNATNGRLVIAPNGVVSVEAENGMFSNAQCFTSLDGASFAKSASSFTSLKLRNGWTNGPFATSAAKVRLISGIVHFRGAIATAGSNPVAFVLPSSFRPVHEVYIQVDLCGATNGRLQIDPSGVVTVEAESGVFSNAQCFTSLDGASFAP